MIQIPRVGAPDEPLLEGWTVLAGLACRYHPYPSRHPVHGSRLSQSRASRQDRGERRSDQPGRLTLGIGAGFFEDEYKQYGWEFPPRPATRIRPMEEAVELILKMWTEPRTTLHGRD